MTTSERPYRGVPPAARKAARRDKLVVAGFHLFATRGVANTRVRDICAEAGLTERYFYESFANTEELLDSVFDRALEMWGPKVQQALSVPDADMLGRTRAALAAVIVPVTDDPRLARLVLVEAFAAGERFAARRLEFMLRAADFVQAWAQSSDESLEIDADDAHLNARAFVGASSEVLVAWLNGQLEIDRERLIDHIAEQFVAIFSTSSLRPIDRVG